MSSIYFTTVTNEKTGEPLALAFGNFGVMNYVAKDALSQMKNAEAGTTFAARIVEVENYGDESEKRSLVQVTGDADVVTYVVKKKIAAERKEQAPAETETETDGADADNASAEQLETV